MNAKEAIKVWKKHMAKMKEFALTRNKVNFVGFLDEARKDRALQEAMVYISEHHLCPTCGKKMKMCVDSKTGKLSEYIWRCKCMPKGMQLMIG